MLPQLWALLALIATASAAPINNTTPANPISLAGRGERRCVKWQPKARDGGAPPPAEGAPPPPAEGAPPAGGAPPAEGAPPVPGPPPAEGAPAANGVPPTNAPPAANGVPSTNGVPPATTNTPPPATNGTAAPSGSILHQWGTNKMRGVNLGSWLLLEAWMGPGDIGEMNGGFIDQWIWDEKAKTDQAFADRRTKHWAEWITDADIDEIAAVGLNTVRIPIGYWTFLSQAELDAVQVPFSPDGLPYLQKIIQKCASVGVAVLLDFHGLPSSQNGADHSGQGLHKDGQTDPAPFFFNDAAKASAVKAIANAAAMFAAPEYGGIVTTIQLANEPNPRNGASTQGKAENEGFDFLKGFFEEAYAAIRAVDTKVNVMFADGWADVTGDYWKSWGTDMQNVSMDTHYYTLYTPESQGMSGDDRIKWFCDRRDTLANAHMPTVVGEFSLQVPKEQPDGNGGDPANPQVQGFMRKSWVAQSATWEQGAGWTYWTWKHRDDNAWSFQQMLKVGVIPTPVTQYAVPNPCGWAQGQGQGQPPQQ